MSEHRASIAWRREGPDFDYDTYDRTHTVRFASSGLELLASTAPDFHGRADAVNPSEQLAGALASCHMLTFLAVAAKSGLVVDAYEDTAEVRLGMTSEGRLMVITRIALRPRVTFAGAPPSEERLRELHARAHRTCVVSSALRVTVDIHPVIGRGD